MLRLILFLAALVLIVEAGLVAKEKEVPETAFQVKCGDITIIVTPATAPHLAEVQKLAACMGTEKQTCTIETVKLMRKASK